MEKHHHQQQDLQVCSAPTRGLCVDPPSVWFIVQAEDESGLCAWLIDTHHLMFISVSQMHAHSVVTVFRVVPTWVVT